MTKTLDGYFCDWNRHVFGFGYGTGERPVLRSLTTFLSMCNHHSGRSYDYQELEAELTPPVTWLLINALCNHNILEYGTSPRFGWLTPQGERLREYVQSKTEDDLVDIANWDAPDDYEGPCHPDCCNCGPNGYEKGRICQNPFWLENLS